MSNVSDDKQTVLVVDDTPENIDVLVGTLKDDYNVKAVTSGEVALRAIYTMTPDIILLDIMMPGIDGFEVCRILQADPTTRHIPVIFITAKIAVEDELEGLRTGAVDYITKPISPPIVQARVRTHLALANQQAQLERLVIERTQELQHTRLSIIQRLGRAAEYKDDDTGLHVIRMSKFSRILGLAAGMSDYEADLLMHAAPMHDIGKIGIPDEILKKPGKLTPDELAIMQQHCVIGAEIIGEEESPLMQIARTVALTHHEKWDGSGYPMGLEGDQIPRVGRIVAIADVFDALTSTRPYKKAWKVADAIEYLEASSGLHFDPHLVKLFIKAMPEVQKIRKAYQKN